jgi:hypothetical protein
VTRRTHGDTANRPIDHHDSTVTAELFAFPLAWIWF